MFKLYFYKQNGTRPEGIKIYLDGSASEGYSEQTAKDFARDNASSMPHTRIYVENADTGKDDCSYINVNGRISTELY